MALEIAGKIYKIFDEQSISATFKKREFVIETDEQYPQLVKFELTQDRCSLISDYNEGEKITVHFNVRGREWNEKYFVNLQAWRIVREEAAASNATPPTASTEVEETDAAGDDLPF